MSVTHYHVLRQGGGRVFVTSLHLKLRPCQQKKHTHSKVQRSDFSCEKSMYCSHVKKCPVSKCLPTPHYPLQSEVSSDLKCIETSDV